VNKPTIDVHYEELMDNKNLNKEFIIISLDTDSNVVYRQAQRHLAISRSSYYNIKTNFGSGAVDPNPYVP